MIRFLAVGKHVSAWHGVHSGLVMRATAFEGVQHIVIDASLSDERRPSMKINSLSRREQHKPRVHYFGGSPVLFHMTHMESEKATLRWRQTIAPADNAEVHNMSRYLAQAL